MATKSKLSNEQMDFSELLIEEVRKVCKDDLKFEKF